MTIAPENILWRANPGAQERFLASCAHEVLFGGRAGGGKSDAILMAAFRQTDNSQHRAIIFRRAFPRLKDLIARSFELFSQLGGSYNKVERQWTFPSGSIIEFGYLDAPEDVYVYQGRAFSFIGFDELGEWPADALDAEGQPINRAFLYMASRLRATEGSGLDLEIRATCNPGGPGHEWIQRRYAIPGDGSPSRVVDPRTGFVRVFLPSTLCPQLAGTNYETALGALSAQDRAALRDGRWDAHKDDEIFLGFDLLTPCQYSPNAAWRKPLHECGDLFLGVDIGRVHDLTVFYVLERAEDVLFTREIIALRGVDFDAQERQFNALLALPNLRRACVDETGIGRQFAERGQTRHGYRVEPVTFTAATKEELAYPVRAAFERRGIRIPADQDVLDDLRSIRRTNTTAGNVRFDAARTADGHGDRFWALALAVHAAGVPTAFKVLVI